MLKLSGFGSAIVIIGRLGSFTTTLEIKPMMVSKSDEPTIRITDHKTVFPTSFASFNL